MKHQLNLDKIAKRTAVLTIAATALLGSGHADAQDRGIAFEAGLGPRYAPLYEGSSDYRWSPGVTGGVSAVSLGSIQFQSKASNGLSFGPSFRYLAAREVADTPALAGIPDRDWAFEIGGKAVYRWDNAQVFGAVRKGLNGHTGVVADLGSDVIFRPSESTVVKFGPRLSMANTSYMDTYFSVPGTATVLTPYAASGGAKSAGIELSVRHDLSDRWSVEGIASWNRLIGDAASSPIVQAGDRDQFSIGVMMIRQFDWRF